LQELNIYGLLYTFVAEQHYLIELWPKQQKLLLLL
jgi:hypothetical protein